MPYHPSVRTVITFNYIIKRVKKEGGNAPAMGPYPRRRSSHFCAWHYRFSDESRLAHNALYGQENGICSATNRMYSKLALKKSTGCGCWFYMCVWMFYPSWDIYSNHVGSGTYDQAHVPIMIGVEKSQWSGFPLLPTKYAVSSIHVYPVMAERNKNCRSGFEKWFLFPFDWWCGIPQTIIFLRPESHFFQIT